jgi:hypothetical protein
LVHRFRLPVAMDAAAPLNAAALGPVHRRRLREVWRSAGWPCRDGVEAELLAAGWLQRVFDDAGRETLRVSDDGVRVLAETLQGHRRRFDAHEALVARVAGEAQRDGRLVWRGLALRAPVDGAWVVARPDVFSIRHTTLESALEPVVHEIKVGRADLLADLRRPGKGAAYAALASRCWYVLREGIGEPDEVPAAYGVIVARGDALEVARAAPARPFRPSLPWWMALARAAPEPVDDDAQGRLGAPLAG